VVDNGTFDFPDGGWIWLCNYDQMGEDEMEVALCRDMDWLRSEEAFSIYASCMYKPTYDAFKKRMESYASNPLVKVYVCTEDSEQIAILVLQRSNAEAEIMGIAVSERFQNRGIGRRMIFQVMELEKLECIKARTDDDAIGFYRSCGFHDEKTVGEYSDCKVVRYNCVLPLRDMENRS